MKIGIPKEIRRNEKRVACTPGEVQKLMQLGYQVFIEKDAGLAANYSNEDYRVSGARVIEQPSAIWHEADVVCKVQPPAHHPVVDQHEADWLTGDKTLICFIWPAQNTPLMNKLSALGTTVLAMDCVPRLSRAQNMDALSSMANIAGYRAVIEAAQHFGRFFTGQITAAGKIPPAKIMVIGAGVAGLAAIGAAVSLGGIVRAFDTRPEVKEQIESMNAEFLELAFDEDGTGQGGYAKVMSDAFIEAEMALFSAQAKEVDIIITTALIPGKAAPTLITEEMVKSMRPGSLIVDLAAEQGGNCALTQPDQVVDCHGVKIIGYTDHPSRMSTQSSQLYSTNLRHLMTELTPNKDGQIEVDLDDEVIRGTTVIHRGAVIWPPPSPRRPTPAVEASTPDKRPAHPINAEAVLPKNRRWLTLAGMLVGAGALISVGSVAPATFMNHFVVFVLACFIGWQVIWNVTPALHTPLMSVTNAISGIIILGALLQIGSPSSLGVSLALIAVLLASINIAGGFLVTQRMLNMFRKKED